MALHLRWLTTEKFQHYETVKGGCIPSKNKFKTIKNNKLRWLASDINFKLLHTGFAIAHDIFQNYHTRGAFQTESFLLTGNCKLNFDLC